MFGANKVVWPSKRNALYAETERDRQKYIKSDASAFSAGAILEISLA